MKHLPLIINIDTPILQNWLPTEVRAKVALVLGDVGLGIRDNLSAYGGRTLPGQVIGS